MKATDRYTLSHDKPSAVMMALAQRDRIAADYRCYQRLCVKFPQMTNDLHACRRTLHRYKWGFIVTLTLVAFYFSLMVVTQAWPVTVGPYATWAECASVREYIDRRGYETGGCGVMPYPQPDSVLLQVIDVP